MPSTELQDEQLILSLARGSTIAAAAESAGVSERTVYRRLEDDLFRNRVSAHRDAMVGCVTGRLAAVNVEAANTLATLLKSADEKIQLQAAKACIELGMKIRDSNEIGERITALERKYDEQQEKELATE